MANEYFKVIRVSEGKFDLLAPNGGAVLNSTSNKMAYVIQHHLNEQLSGAMETIERYQKFDVFIDTISDMKQDYAKSGIDNFADWLASSEEWRRELYTLFAILGTDDNS